ncbi:hypothetical protein MPH_03710 [Macrophomina phaseolina MS6]|uniref:Uncharacterized protein n=1 Tax=Macrophomina phaseolina (strain MS6) TaxID=1126212 RepID=K2SQT5_MACPH|nr:hypothetical protein MPH_03710 [Macrophomina phaseolina MS6]
MPLYSTSAIDDSEGFTHLPARITGRRDGAAEQPGFDRQEALSKASDGVSARDWAAMPTKRQGCKEHTELISVGHNATKVDGDHPIISSYAKEMNPPQANFTDVDLGSDAAFQKMISKAQKTGHIKTRDGVFQIDLRRVDVDDTKSIAASAVDDSSSICEKIMVRHAGTNQKVIAQKTEHSLAAPASVEAQARKTAQRPTHLWGPVPGIHRTQSAIVWKQPACKKTSAITEPVPVAVPKSQMGPRIKPPRFGGILIPSKSGGSFHFVNSSGPANTCRAFRNRPAPAAPVEQHEADTGGRAPAHVQPALPAHAPAVSNYRAPSVESASDAESGIGGLVALFD